MSDTVDRLRRLLPELSYARETHIQWRDCEQEYRDNNPDIGSREFHAKQVGVYTERIAVIKEAIRVLEFHVRFYADYKTNRNGRE